LVPAAIWGFKTRSEKPLFHMIGSYSLGTDPALELVWAPLYVLLIFIQTSHNSVSGEWLNAYERGFGEHYSLHASEPD
jgi:hypothetical protein